MALMNGKEKKFVTIDYKGTIIYNADGNISHGSHNSELTRDILESTLALNLRNLVKKRDISVYLAIPSSLREGLLGTKEVPFNDLEAKAIDIFKKLEITDYAILSIPQAALYSCEVPNRDHESSDRNPWEFSVVWDKSSVDMALLRDRKVKEYANSRTVKDSFDVSSLLKDIFLRITEADSKIVVDASENIVLSGDHPHLERLRWALEAKFDAGVYQAPNPERAVLDGLMRYAKKTNPLTDLITIARSII